MENWDLQAVLGVGGCSSNDGGDAALLSALDMDQYPFSFDPFCSIIQHDDLLSFSEIFEKNGRVVDELEQLYKPFYPESSPQLVSTHSTIDNSQSVPPDDDHVIEKPQILARQKSLSQSAKSRRRKNQQNRVVQHVTADGLSSDLWAWRKYGQKPIKGSPYPRSYYRCSSLKGCLARKQVERSCSDPRIFIITYTAEHSHGHPTRRSSLAGSTRSKFSPAKLPPAINEPNNRPSETEKYLSPTITLVTSTEDDFVQQESTKIEAEQMLVDRFEGDKIFSPDVTLSGELAQRLDDLEAFFLDQFP